MRVSMLLALLATSLMTTACQTRTTERIAADLDSALVTRICAEAWRPVSYDSRADSAETAEEARANNRARTAFCGEIP